MSDAFQTPPPTISGDRVAVVAPSSGGAANACHVLALSLRRLREEFELEPIVYPTARQSDEFLDCTVTAVRTAHTANRRPTQSTGL